MGIFRKGKARRLAYRECAGAAKFPKIICLEKKNIHKRFQMIGNAVPPPLFEAVVKNLKGI